MTTAVKRACDACHRRKVKCDGINPCRNCSSAQLSCTYNAIPQKKGPKGSRAKVISELRETQRQTNLANKVNSRLHGVASPPIAPVLSPTPGLLTREMVKECIDFYFNHMYPIIPILHRQQLEHEAMAMDTNLDTYCLLTSLCAFIMLQPGMSMPTNDPYGLDAMAGGGIATSTLLLEETIRVRKAYDYLESPTLNSLCTSYLLFATYYVFQFHEKAWFHLREATTVAHMIGMNKEESYVLPDNASMSRRRRLYWLLFVSERAYALQHRRPLTLQATINPPTPNDDPSDPFAHQLSSFVLLVNLFRPFDDQFVNLWNKSYGDCSSAFVGQLQKQLTGVLPAYLNGTDPQLADVRANQTWLKNMTWQFNMSRGNVNDQGMQPMQFPVDVSRDLLAMTSAFSTQNMELISGGFVEKLYEVASSLVDVLSIQPASRDPFADFNPHDSLQQVLNLIGVVRNGESRFLPLLLCKMNGILPRLIDPKLQAVPEMACSIDIFDGFGNAGLGNVPQMNAMEEYESKFSVPRIEEFKTEPSISPGASAPSVTDMASPFVSSPVVLSPGIDFSHGLPPQDFNSMSDMVMSPVGPRPNAQLNTPGGVGGQQHQQSLPQTHPHHASSQQHPPHQQQPHQPHQQQHNPQTIPMFQGVNHSHNMNGHFQNSMHPGMSQPPNIAAITSHVSSQHPQGLGVGMGSGYGAGGAVMNGSLGQIGQGMTSGMMMRQQPPRANSFAHPQPSQLRTVGDFQALQRTNSDMSAMTPLSAMGSSSGGMSTEIDFNTLPSR